MDSGAVRQPSQVLPVIDMKWHLLLKSMKRVKDIIIEPDWQKYGLLLVPCRPCVVRALESLHALLCLLNW